MLKEGLFGDAFLVAVGSEAFDSIFVVAAMGLGQWLAHMDSALKPGDLDLPGYRLHPLKGDLAGMWSVSISGNWRVVFRFVDGDAFDIDLVDYR